MDRLTICLSHGLPLVLEPEPEVLEEEMEVTLAKGLQTIFAHFSLSCQAPLPRQCVLP